MNSHERYFQRGQQGPPLLRPASPLSEVREARQVCARAVRRLEHSLRHMSGGKRLCQGRLTSWRRALREVDRELIRLEKEAK